MLSYQHAYHAGNLADLHKHATLAWVLYFVYPDSEAARALGWRVGVELVARLIASHLTFRLIRCKCFAPRPPAAPITLTFSVGEDAAARVGERPGGRDESHIRP